MGSLRKIDSPGAMEAPLLISTTENIPGRPIKRFFGVVSGGAVQSRSFEIAAAIRNLFGGALASHTKRLQECREDALERMVAEAESLGANAVVNVRFSTGSITQSAAEMFAYGTAVQVD